MTKSNEYKLNDILVFKKTHPCGSDSWKVLRIGSDMKLECVGCKRVIIINDGKIVMDDSMKNLKYHYMNKKIVILID